MNPADIFTPLVTALSIALGSVSSIVFSLLKIFGDRQHERIKRQDAQIDRDAAFLKTVMLAYDKQREQQTAEDKQQLEEDKHYLELEDKLRKSLDALILCANSRITLIQEKGELLSRIKDLEEILDEYQKGPHVTKPGVG